MSANCGRTCNGNAVVASLIVDNSNGRQCATCSVLGALFATFWATVPFDVDKVRPSQKVKVLWKMRTEETKSAWHFTVSYLPI